MKINEICKYLEKYIEESQRKNKSSLHFFRDVNFANAQTAVASELLANIQNILAGNFVEPADIDISIKTRLQNVIKSAFVKEYKICYLGIFRKDPAFRDKGFSIIGHTMNYKNNDQATFEAELLKGYGTHFYQYLYEIRMQLNDIELDSGLVNSSTDEVEMLQIRPSTI